MNYTCQIEVSNGRFIEAYCPNGYVIPFNVQFKSIKQFEKFVEKNSFIFQDINKELWTYYLDNLNISFSYEYSVKQFQNVCENFQTAFENRIEDLRMQLYAGYVNYLNEVANIRYPYFVLDEDYHV